MTLRPNAIKGFSKIAAARELIRERAEEILDLLINNAKMAQARGQHDVADKTYKWLLEHMPTAPGEESIINPSIDKQQVTVSKDSGPRIQIGIQVGGTSGKQKAIPSSSEIIDVEPE